MKYSKIFLVLFSLTFSAFLQASADETADLELMTPAQLSFLYHHSYNPKVIAAAEAEIKRREGKNPSTRIEERKKSSLAKAFSREEKDEKVEKVRSLEKLIEEKQKELNRLYFPGNYYRMKRGSLSFEIENLRKEKKALMLACYSLSMEQKEERNEW